MLWFTISYVNAAKASTRPKFAGGQYHTVALKSDGTLWAWGGNVVGHLGDGTTISRHSPEQIGTESWVHFWLLIRGPAIPKIIEDNWPTCGGTFVFKKWATPSFCLPSYLLELYLDA
jgi:hypothetical protein